MPVCFVVPKECQKASMKVCRQGVKKYGTREEVWQRKALETRYGLDRTMLRRSHKKIVSLLEFAKHQRQQKTNLARWNRAVMCARKLLNLHGFVSVRRGEPLHTKARELYDCEGFGPDYVYGVLSIE